MQEKIRGKKFARKSLAGPELTIDGYDNIKVNGSHIVAAGMEASNGVIHVIDSVVLPQAA